jgi:hypothetical protein
MFQSLILNLPDYNLDNLAFRLKRYNKQAKKNAGKIRHFLIYEETG